MTRFSFAVPLQIYAVDDGRKGEGKEMQRKDRISLLDSWLPCTYLREMNLCLNGTKRDDARNWAGAAAI